MCQNVAKSCVSDVWSKKKSAEESFDCNGRFAILSEVRRSIGVLAYSIGLIIVYELKPFYSYLIIPRECQRSHLLLPLFVRNQENTSGPLRLHARPTAALTWLCYGRIKKDRLTDKKVFWLLPSAANSVPYSRIFLRAHVHVLRAKRDQI